MIGFATPWVLFGLLAAAVPILLHLLARRDPPTVVFPAVRYLGQAAQQFRRRVSLQHWLLLLIRTLVIVALVLAAAGPTLAGRAAGPGGGHAPAGLVLVVDNSVSSGAVRDGTPTLETLRTAAHGVLDHAGPEDELILLAADGVPRRADRATLRDLVDSLTATDRRLDLGDAVGRARDVLAGGTLPGEIVVLTDLQATAVTPADLGEVPVLVARPSGPPPRNTGVAGLTMSPQPWTAEGGLVSVRLPLAPAEPVPLTLRLGGQPPRQLLADGLQTSALRLSPAPGWHLLTAELAPDELRADDARVAAVRVAPPARVTWTTTDRWIATAAEVLAANGRITAGSGVTLGRLGPGVSIVTPPADPAQVGALNRTLAARGIPWQYGALRREAARADSGALPGTELVHRRYALDPTGGAEQGVVARVQGAPWIVRSGDVVLLGSRLEPEWTDLPVAAAFLPFLDALVNRVARGELVGAETAPGDPVFLPDRATTVHAAAGDREWRVEGGARWAPAGSGVYFVLAGRDTLGTIAANPDARESDLTPMSDDALERLWPGVRIVSLADAPGRAFSAGARADLRGPLLWLILGLAIAEMVLARGSREEKA